MACSCLVRVVLFHHLAHFCRADLPKEPPFKAHLGNLKFDVSEYHIQDFFKQRGSNCTNVHIVKGDDGRVRGFAYAEFATVTDLKKALEQNGEVR